MKPIERIIPLLAFVALVQACSADKGVVAPATSVASVTVVPRAATLLSGDTVRLVATASDPSGHILQQRAISWTTSDGAVATVATTGLVTGARSGTATITAAVEGRSDTAGIVVLSGATDLVGVWDWTEHFDDPTNAVTCDDTGSYAFTASAAGFAGTSYQVGTCGTPQGPLDNTHSDPVANGAVSVGAIGFDVGSDASCHYTAVLSGSLAQLTGTATCGSASGTWRAVRGGAVASVAVAPRAATVPPGGAVVLSAELRNASGDRVFARPIAWSSDAPQVAAVSDVGLLTALAGGRTTVRVSAGSVSGAAPILVAGDSVVDPVGDTYGSPDDLSQPDITVLAAAHDSDGLTIVIGLANPTGIGGYVDLDVDQNPATGGLAQVDAYRPDPGGSSGLGDEFVVDLFNHLLVDVVNGTNVDYVASVYNGNTVTLRIPLRELAGSNGQVNLAVVVGDDNGPTDIAPNAGHLTMGAPGSGTAPAAVAGGSSLRRVRLSWPVGRHGVVSAPSRHTKLPVAPAR